MGEQTGTATPWDHQGAGGYRPGPLRQRPRGTGPWRRARENQMAGGVAAGLAARTGFDVTAVRTIFIVASLLGGFGIAAYVLAWLLVPATGEDASIANSAASDRRGIALAAALGSVLIVVLLLASAFGAPWLGQLAWPLILSAAGMVLIWRNAPAGEQATLHRLAEPLAIVGRSGPRLPTFWRITIAAVTLVSGLIILLEEHPSLALLPLAGLALVVAAITILLGPWWLHIARDLMVERQARARAEERADMAARIHDSVLQTLALIQRRADTPQQVISLARAQERELRSWLFEGRPPGVSSDGARSLADGVRLIQQDVEAQHGIAVETVTVGNCDLDDDLGALLAAAREATVNAAKWSGAAVVSLFAEVEPGQVSVFVRDRGRGFDPAAVPSDRKGLAESVHARMTRRGGSATVRSGDGAGTEVALTLPRTAGRPQPDRS